MPQDKLNVIQAVVENQSVIGESVFTIVSSILIAGGAAALWIRRKLSKDSLEIKKESIESDLLQHLEDERDVLKLDKEKLLERLIHTDKEKNEAVYKVGQLTVEVEHLREEVTSLRDLVKMLGDKLDRVTNDMRLSHSENVKLIGDLKVMNEIFELRCSACPHKKHNCEQ